MSMRETVQRVIELSEEYEAKRQVHTEEHGVELGLELGTQKSEHYFEATERLPLKLARFLEMPSLSELLKLQTLVYFGRGDDEDIRRLHEHLKETTPNREDVTRTLISKIGALTRYLESALARAEERGMDIEGPFE